VVISEASHLADQITSGTVIVCWWVFGLTFWLRKKPPRAREARRDRSSLIGMLLQVAAYFIVWLHPLLRRQLLIEASGSQTLNWILALVTVTIAIASVYLVNSAARRLGKQWSLTARVVEGHTLIQDGPYRFVRNPIYTGMFGMLLATGIASGQWIALLVASAVFILGTYIRVRSEEQLLREAFGSEFEKYEHKVSALIPGVY
jgi:protein-S-isoprenylcysteine O-methyltransferase Ste14